MVEGGKVHLFMDERLELVTARDVNIKPEDISAF